MLLALPMVLRSWTYLQRHHSVLIVRLARCLQGLFHLLKNEQTRYLKWFLLLLLRCNSAPPKYRPHPLRLPSSSSGAELLPCRTCPPLCRTCTSSFRSCTSSHWTCPPFRWSSTQKQGGDHRCLTLRSKQVIHYSEYTPIKEENLWQPYLKPSSPLKG